MIIFKFGVGAYLEDEFTNNQNFINNTGKSMLELSKMQLSSSSNISFERYSKLNSSTVWQVAIAPNENYIAVLLTTKLYSFALNQTDSASQRNEASLPENMQQDCLSRKLYWGASSRFIILFGDGGKEISFFSNTCQQLIVITMDIFNGIVPKNDLCLGIAPIIEHHDPNTEETEEDGDYCKMHIIFTSTTVITVRLHTETGNIEILSNLADPLLPDKMVESFHWMSSSACLLLVSADSNDSLIQSRKHDRFASVNVLKYQDPLPNSDMPCWQYVWQTQVSRGVGVVPVEEESAGGLFTAAATGLVKFLSGVGTMSTSGKLQKGSRFHFPVVQVSSSPDGRWVILLHGDGMISIFEFPTSSRPKDVKPQVLFDRIHPESYRTNQKSLDTTPPPPQNPQTTTKSISFISNSVFTAVSTDGSMLLLELIAPTNSPSNLKQGNEKAPLHRRKQSSLFSDDVNTSSGETILAPASVAAVPPPLGPFTMDCLVCHSNSNADIWDSNKLTHPDWKSNSRSWLIFLRTIDSFTAQLFSVRTLTPREAVSAHLEEGDLNSSLSLAEGVGMAPDAVFMALWDLEFRKPFHLKAGLKTGSRVSNWRLDDGESSNRGKMTASEVLSRIQESDVFVVSAAVDYSGSDACEWRKVLIEGIRRTNEVHLSTLNVLSSTEEYGEVQSVLGSSLTPQDTFLLTCRRVLMLKLRKLTFIRKLVQHLVFDHIEQLQDGLEQKKTRVLTDLEEQESGKAYLDALDVELSDQSMQLKNLEDSSFFQNVYAASLSTSGVLETKIISEIIADIQSESGEELEFKKENEGSEYVGEGFWVLMGFSLEQLTLYCALKGLNEELKELILPRSSYQNLFSSHAPGNSVLFSFLNRIPVSVDPLELTELLPRFPGHLTTDKDKLPVVSFESLLEEETMEGEGEESEKDRVFDSTEHEGVIAFIDNFISSEVFDILKEKGEFPGDLNLTGLLSSYEFWGVESSIAFKQTSTSSILEGREEEVVKWFLQRVLALDSYGFTAHAYALSEISVTRYEYFLKNNENSGVDNSDFNLLKEICLQLKHFSDLLYNGLIPLEVHFSRWILLPSQEKLQIILRHHFSEDQDTRDYELVAEDGMTLGKYSLNEIIRRFLTPIFEGEKRIFSAVKSPHNLVEDIQRQEGFRNCCFHAEVEESLMLFEHQRHKLSSQIPNHPTSDPDSEHWLHLLVHILGDWTINFRPEETPSEGMFFLEQVVEVAENSKPTILQQDRCISSGLLLAELVARSCYSSDQCLVSFRDKKTEVLDLLWRLLECCPSVLNGSGPISAERLTSELDKLQGALTVWEVVRGLELTLYPPILTLIGALDVEFLPSSIKGSGSVRRRRREFAQSMLNGCGFLAVEVGKVISSMEQGESRGSGSLPQEVIIGGLVEGSSIEVLSNVLTFYQALILRICIDFGARWKETHDNGTGSSSNSWLFLADSVFDLCQLSVVQEEVSSAWAGLAIVQTLLYVEAEEEYKQLIHSNGSPGCDSPVRTPSGKIRDRAAPSSAGKLRRRSCSGSSSFPEEIPHSDSFCSVPTLGQKLREMGVAPVAVAELLLRKSREIFNSVSSCDEEAELAAGKKLLDIIPEEHLTAEHRTEGALYRIVEFLQKLQLDFVPVQLRLLDPVEIVEQVLQQRPEAYYNMALDGEAEEYALNYEGEGMGSPDADASVDLALKKNFVKQLPIPGKQFIELLLQLTGSGIAYTQFNQQSEIKDNTSICTYIGLQLKMLNTAVSLSDISGAYRLANSLLQPTGGLQHLNTNLKKSTLSAVSSVMSLLKTEEIRGIALPSASADGRFAAVLEADLRCSLLLHCDPDLLEDHAALWRRTEIPLNNTVVSAPMDSPREGVNEHLTKATELVYKVIALVLQRGTRNEEVDSWSLVEVKAHEEVQVLLEDISVPGILQAALNELLLTEDPSVARSLLVKASRDLNKKLVASRSSKASASAGAVGMISGDYWANEELVTQLMTKGFSRNGAKRAVLATSRQGAKVDGVVSNSGTFEAALVWAVQHSMDPDFEHPVTAVVSGALAREKRSSTNLFPSTSSFGDVDVSTALLQSEHVDQPTVFPEADVREALSLVHKLLECFPGGPSGASSSSGRSSPAPPTKVVQAVEVTQEREELESKKTEGVASRTRSKVTIGQPKSPPKGEKPPRPPSVQKLEVSAEEMSEAFFGDQLVKSSTVKTVTEVKITAEKESHDVDDKIDNIPTSSETELETLNINPIGIPPKPLFTRSQSPDLLIPISLDESTLTEDTDYYDELLLQQQQRVVGALEFAADVLQLRVDPPRLSALASAAVGYRPEEQMTSSPAEGSDILEGLLEEVYGMCCGLASSPGELAVDCFTQILQFIVDPTVVRGEVAPFVEFCLKQLVGVLNISFEKEQDVTKVRDLVLWAFHALRLKKFHLQANTEVSDILNSSVTILAGKPIMYLTLLSRLYMETPSARPSALERIKKLTADALTAEKVIFSDSTSLGNLGTISEQELFTWLLTQWKSLSNFSLDASLFARLKQVPSGEREQWVGKARQNLLEEVALLRRIGRIPDQLAGCKQLLRSDGLFSTPCLMSLFPAFPEYQLRLKQELNSQRDRALTELSRHLKLHSIALWIRALGRVLDVTPGDLHFYFALQQVSVFCQEKEQQLVVVRVNSASMEIDGEITGENTSDGLLLLCDAMAAAVGKLKSSHILQLGLLLCGIKPSHCELLTCNIPDRTPLSLLTNLLEYDDTADDLMDAEKTVLTTPEKAFSLSAEEAEVVLEQVSLCVEKLNVAESEGGNKGSGKTSSIKRSSSINSNSGGASSAGEALLRKRLSEVLDILCSLCGVEHNLGSVEVSLDSSSLDDDSDDVDFELSKFNTFERAKGFLRGLIIQENISADVFSQVLLLAEKIVNITVLTDLNLSSADDLTLNKESPFGLKADLFSQALDPMWLELRNSESTPGLIRGRFQRFSSVFKSWCDKTHLVLESEEVKAVMEHFFSHLIEKSGLQTNDSGLGGSPGFCTCERKSGEIDNSGVLEILECLGADNKITENSINCLDMSLMDLLGVYALVFILKTAETAWEKDRSSEVFQLLITRLYVRNIQKLLASFDAENVLRKIIFTLDAEEERGEWLFYVGEWREFERLFVVLLKSCQSAIEKNLKTNTCKKCFYQHSSTLLVNFLRRSILFYLPLPSNVKLNISDDASGSTSHLISYSLSLIPCLYSPLSPVERSQEGTGGDSRSFRDINVGFYQSFISYLASGKQIDLLIESLLIDRSIFCFLQGKGLSVFEKPNTYQHIFDIIPKDSELYHQICLIVGGFLPDDELLMKITQIEHFSELTLLLLSALQTVPLTKIVKNPTIYAEIVKTLTKPKEEISKTQPEDNPWLTAKEITKNLITPQTQVISNNGFLSDLTRKSLVFTVKYSAVSLVSQGMFVEGLNIFWMTLTLPSNMFSVSTAVSLFLQFVKDHKNDYCKTWKTICENAEEMLNEAILY